MTDDKRVYFLFSKVETDQSSKAIYNAVIDHFIDNNNNFSTPIDISQYLSSKDLNFSPEAIQEELLRLNYFELFDQLNPEKEINEPFKLKKGIFTNVKNYTDYIQKLKHYTSEFLGSKGHPKKKSDAVIEILLETIFTQNLHYLRKILSAKDEARIGLKVNGNHPDYKKIDCDYYNELILESDTEFDEILRVIILKMFEFLSLNYNRDQREGMKQRFGGKVFYLDSSFILRLFGFDNDIREDRSIKLVNILKEIPDVEFVVHHETIKEAQYRIEELISQCIPMIQHRERIIKDIFKYIPEKGKNVVNLYFRLKSSGRINNEKDFLLLFSNITKRLKSIFNSERFRIDDKNIKITSEKTKDLINGLAKTEKTQLRKKHIIKLLNHVEYLRGPNNYNPFDIKYWLITTDGKTLDIDSEICKNSDTAQKSVCILPTELIRMIDGVGEITGDHLAVFKKFILKSHIFAESFTRAEVRTIERIALMVETVDLDKYDPEILISNLFEKNSYADIQKRLDFIDSEEKKNTELIQMFNDANEGYIETKYSGVIFKLSAKYISEGRLIFAIIVFLFPAILFIIIANQVINPDLVITDLNTYFLKEKWDALNAIITIFESIIIVGAAFLYNSYKQKFVNWYSKKMLLKYKDS